MTRIVTSGSDQDRSELVIALQKRIELLEQENGRLRALLNNPRKLIERGLALLTSHRELLLILAGLLAGILLTSSTPIGGWLEGAWRALWQSPPAHQPAPAGVAPFFPDGVAAPPSPTAPLAPPLISSPAAPPPPLPVTLKAMSVPSPLRTCNGNHLPTDPICPPIGRKPSPLPSLPLP